MSREIVNKSPTRKTLVTGESLPAVETEARPIPLGYDEDGEPDAQIRAFAVLARNRSDSPVYISEGATDDENVIDAGESFQIWEPDGVSDVQIRGENGGERVEFRTLEAHNDFSITDKIDAFSRALSHFFGTSRRSTTIEGDVDIGTFSDTVTVDSIQSGTVDIGSFADTVTVDDITAASATFDVAGTVDVGQFADTVTIEDIQTGTVDANVTNSTLTVDSVTGGIDANVSGNVDIGTFSDTVTIDDITSASATLTVDSVSGGIDANVAGDVDANITNSSIDVAGGVDITGQDNTFDLSTYSRQGKQDYRFLADSGTTADYNSTLGDYVANSYTWTLFNGAPNDGYIQAVNARFYESNTSYLDQMGFLLKINGEIVNPRHTQSAFAAYNFGNDAGDVSISQYDENFEVVYGYEPYEPVKFEAGDTVALVVEPDDTGQGGTNDSYAFNVELGAVVTEISHK